MFWNDEGVCVSWCLNQCSFCEIHLGWRLTGSDLIFEPAAVRGQGLSLWCFPDGRRVVRALGPLVSLSLPNLSSTPLCPTARPPATWWGYRLPAMAAGEGSSLALQLPAPASFFTSCSAPTAWSFFAGGSSAVMAGLESCLGFSEFTAECTLGPAEPPGALVELAQELPQLISGLRKPSVVCHIFHPLFFSGFGQFSCQQQWGREEAVLEG